MNIFVFRHYFEIFSEIYFEAFPNSIRILQQYEEAAQWPSSQRVGLALQRSQIRILFWPLSRFVLWWPRVQILRHTCKQPSGLLPPLTSIYLKLFARPHQPLCYKHVLPRLNKGIFIYLFAYLFIQLCMYLFIYSLADDSSHSSLTSFNVRSSSVKQN